MPLAPVRPARWDAPSDFTAEVQQHHRVHPSSHGVRVGDDIEGIPRAAFSAISSVGIRRSIAKYTRSGCSLLLVIVTSEACGNLLHDGSLPIEAALRREDRAGVPFKVATVDRPPPVMSRDREC